MAAPTTRTGASRGFTLVEMMTVVAIVAVLATIAAPSFAELIATQRVRAAAAALTESLWVARAEATKRNTDVAFTFIDVATDWSIADPGGTDTPLFVQAGFVNLATTTQNAGSVRFSFNAYGRLSSGRGWVQIGDSQLGIYRCVTVSPSGRATMAKGTCT